jgi:hypothetical protein
MLRSPVLKNNKLLYAAGIVGGGTAAILEAIFIIPEYSMLAVVIAIALAGAFYDIHLS